MFQDKKSVFYFHFGNSSIVYSLKPRERINDLWMVNIQRKIQPHIKLELRLSVLNSETYIYMLVRDCLLDAAWLNKVMEAKAVYMSDDLYAFFTLPRKRLSTSKEIISLRKAEFVTKWDETVLSNTNLNQP